MRDATAAVQPTPPALTRPELESTEPGRELTRPRSAGFRLVAYGMDGRVTQILGETMVHIGRVPGSARLELGDGRVSREHATIERRRDGRYELRDNSSRNGVFVNARPVDRCTLFDGDIVRVGDSLIVFELGPYEGTLARLDESMATTHTRVLAAAAAASSLPVLLTGPTGVGKSWFARQIAALSDYRTPFVEVNCGALAPSLIEAELFGATRGAFTGAVSDRAGYFEAAQGGTLFLDEIGTLSQELQVKLLTVLDTHRVRRVGSTREICVKVRVIAATNADVEAAVRSGLLREDLLFRLAGERLELRPLRLRRADIVPLLLSELGAESHRVLTPEALEALLCAPWPGNVRELLNVAKLLRGVDRPIDYAHLPQGLGRSVAARASESTPDSRRRPNREELRALLEANAWNISAVARELGKFRMQVHRWMKLYRLERGG